jgi:hypothetical protein
MGLEAALVFLHRLWGCRPLNTGRICNNGRYPGLSLFQRGTEASSRMPVAQNLLCVSGHPYDWVHRRLTERSVWDLAP